ncbi:nitrous oxide reductase accessory protein NosL [Halonotius aquaticus]|nr:nitrous oxide reductase accessory protein NosL [Halonotius aquaticus]
MGQTDPEADGNTTDGEAADDETATQPAAIPADANCEVCNMVAADYPAWNAQLTHDTGDNAYFCSSGCLAAYIAEPSRFGGPKASIDTAWVTEYETESFLQASEAFFVRVANPDHVDDVMMKNPTPFATREDAVAFTESFDAYGEDDILRFSDFDMELATFYRGKFFKDDESMNSSEGNESAENTTSTA